MNSACVIDVNMKELYSEKSECIIVGLFFFFFAPSVDDEMTWHIGLDMYIFFSL